MKLLEANVNLLSMAYESVLFARVESNIVTGNIREKLGRRRQKMGPG